MVNAVRTSYVAECFWAGVQEQDVHELDRRIEASVAVVAGDGELVRYWGWLLVIDDEVLWVLLDGPIGTVRRVAEHAGIPFSRILQVTHAPWPNPLADEKVLQ
jgi:hypothetical protein